jgi:hypothetical protein
VCRELARAVFQYFASRAHILRAVPDLAVLTVDEVRHFLAEGCLWNYDPDSVFGHGGFKPVVGEAQKEPGSDNIHMEDGTEDAAAADVPSQREPVREANVSVEQIVIALRQRVDQNPHRSQQRPDSPFRAMLVTLAERDDRAAVENAAVHSILRKLFYEAQVCPALTRPLCETLIPFCGSAQVLYLEGFYQAAEVKYSASILLVHTARALHPVASESQESVASYLTQLESVSYANSAMCVIHRSPPHHRRKVAAPVESKPRASAPSVADVVCGGASLSAALDCIDRSLALWPTPTATWRRILVLEKLHRYASSAVGFV